MENWEEKFKELSETWVDFAFDGEDEYNTQGFEYDEAVDFIKKLLQQTRQDTLRQVLPEYKFVKFPPEEHMREIGHGDCRLEIINKAKEIWGIDFNKD